MAAIDHDASPDLAATGAALAEWLGLARSTARQRRVVRRVCRLAALRSARLAAAATAGVLKHAGYSTGDGSGGGSGGRVVVAVDGSVFAKYDKYK